VETAAFVGEGHGARRPVEQAYTEAHFKPRHGTADPRRCQTECLGGSGEITALHDSGEHPDAGKQSAVKGHDEFLSALC
jgi:hypothetical protein